MIKNRVTILKLHSLDFQKLLTNQLPCVVVFGFNTCFLLCREYTYIYHRLTYKWFIVLLLFCSKRTSKAIRFECLKEL